MRRNVGLAVLAISAIMLVLFLVLSNGTTKYTDRCIGEKDLRQIMLERAEDASLFADIFFDEQELIYDSGSNTYFYSLVEGSKSAFNPRVRVKTDSVGISFLQSEITEELIEGNIAIPAVIYTDRAYKEVSIKCTTLPIMTIDTTDAIDETAIKMELSLYDNRKGARQRLTKSMGRINARGNTTLYYPKKNLRLSLTAKSVGNNTRANDVSLLGMRKDDDWVLYAAYNDEEKVRNVFSSNLWTKSVGTNNSFGVNSGVEYKYLEVFINGEYEGLYALGYLPDSKTLELGNDQNQNALYKSIYWVNFFGVMMPENLVTGYEDKYTPKSEGNEPEYIDNSSWKLLLEYYYNLEKYKDDTDKLLSLTDIDNEIDNVLFLNLIQAIDSVEPKYEKDIYVALTQKDGTLKALLSPWDLDISWGNYWNADIDQNFTTAYGIDATKNAVMEDGYLQRILINGDSDVNDRMVARYESLRANEWSEERLMKMLDEYEKDIYNSGAYLRDRDRWPEGSFQKDPGVKLSRFREYVSLRLSECDKYIERYKTAAKESLLVRRSSQYEGFEECDYLVVINDKSVLNRQEYIDLFNYIGVDATTIDDSVTALVKRGKDGQISLVKDSIFTETTVETTCGEFKIEREDNREYFTQRDVTVSLNGVYCFDTVDEYEPAIRFFFIKNNVAEPFDLTIDYNLDIRIDTFNDIELYIEALEMIPGRILIEGNKQLLCKDEEIKNAIELLGDRVEYKPECEDGFDVIFTVISPDGSIRDRVAFNVTSVNRDGYTKIYALEAVRQ